MFKVHAFVLSAIIIVSGCEQGKDSPRGFSLPKGDYDSGKQVFVELGCLSCHTLKGVESASIPKNPEISVSLGGEVSQIKTYAELVTSIINPSHRIAKGYSAEAVQFEGKSKMPIYNDVMTVTQLTDLVTFLQPFYSLKVYPQTRYSVYYR